jgi:hypothetical protein
MKKDPQNTTQNNSVDLIKVKNGFPDTISFWIVSHLETSSQ